MIGESGFGSPSYNPETVQKDAGFGDPFTEGYRDTGFGSPQDIVQSLSLASVIAEGNALEVSDDGGERVTVYHSTLFTPGTNVRVSFIAQNSTVYPAIGGSRRSPVVVSTDDARIAFFTPMLPVGQYAIRLAIFDAQTPEVITDVTLSTPVFSRPRARCAETYALKKFFSPAISTGKRQAYEDSPSSFGGMEGILQSVGTYLNRLAGRRHTYSTVAWTWGADLSVETTYSFATEGKLVFGDNLLQYTGKTETSFTGVTVLNGYETEHAAATEVTQYV